MVHGVGSCDVIIVHGDGSCDVIVVHGNGHVMFRVMHQEMFASVPLAHCTVDELPHSSN